LGTRALAYPGLTQDAISRGGDLPKRYYDAMDPFVSLTAAGQSPQTKLKVRHRRLPGPTARSIQTAKLVASIDQVSNGRFLFGVGGGWNLG